MLECDTKDYAILATECSAHVQEQMFTKDSDRMLPYIDQCLIFLSEAKFVRERIK